MTDNTDQSESKDRLKITRRQAVATLASVGAIGTAAISSAGDSSSPTGNVGIGGGPMSDELSHLNIRWYEGAEGDLPDPGIDGRFFKITEAGTNFREGDILEDNGDSWDLIDLGVGSFTTDNIDSESYTAATAVSINQLSLLRDDRPTYRLGTLQSYLQVDGLAAHAIFRNQYEVWRWNANGSLEKVVDADESLGTLLMVAQNEIGNWLSFYENNNQIDVIFGVDDSSIESGQGVTQENVETPLMQGVQSWREPGGNWGFLFAEYTGSIENAEDETLRVWRYDTGTDAFTQVHSVSFNDGYGHYHNLDQDPYNPDTYYVTTGHRGTTSWFRSTDYGQTWTKVVDGSAHADDASHWTTIRIVFDDDHLYWAMDATVDDACHLFRAPRSDPEEREHLMTLSDEGPFKAYDICKFDSPNGILVPLRNDDSDDSFDTVPVLWYDLDEGVGRHLTTQKADFAADSRPGVDKMVPYELMGSRGTIANWRGVASPGGVGNGQFEMDVQKLQH